MCALGLILVQLQHPIEWNNEHGRLSLFPPPTWQLSLFLSPRLRAYAYGSAAPALLPFTALCCALPSQLCAPQWRGGGVQSPLRCPPQPHHESAFTLTLSCAQHRQVAAAGGLPRSSAASSVPRQDPLHAQHLCTHSHPTTALSLHSLHHDYIAAGLPSAVCTAESPFAAPLSSRSLVPQIWVKDQDCLLRVYRDFSVSCASPRPTLAEASLQCSFRLCAACPRGETLQSASRVCRQGLQGRAQAQEGIAAT